MKNVVKSVLLLIIACFFVLSCSDEEFEETVDNTSSEKAYIEISRRILGENIEVTIPGKETGLWAKIKSWFSKKYQHIKFENDEFNKLFSAYATNEFEAYKILTPDVMEQFVHLKENTYGDIDIRLLNNRLYVRFLSGDGFVPSLFNKKGEMNSIVSSLAVLEEVQKTMHNVKNIIEKKDLS